MSGAQQLREQLETMRASLQAFEHPAVEEMAGLRLMHKTLLEREAQIAKSIEKNETCSVEITITRGGAGGPATGLRDITGILTAVGDGIEAAGREHAAGWADEANIDLDRALTTHVVTIEAEDSTTKALLTRPPGPLSAQPVDPESGVPLYERAATAFLTGVRDTAADNGAKKPPHALVPAIAQLAEILTRNGITVKIAVEPFALDQDELALDQAAAQRLALRAGGA